MSKVRLTGSNSGYVEIAAAADAGNLTFTMPTSGTALLGNTGNVFSGITTTGQLDINGSIDVSSTSVFNDDVTFTGGSYNVLWNRSNNQLEFGDNAKLSFGASSDLQIYHDGSSTSILNNNNHQLTISSDNALNLTSRTGQEYFFRAYPNNRVELYYDFSSHNTPKLQTSATGVTVDGIVAATSFSGSGEGLTYTSQLSHRNKIINGAMIVSQRATSFTAANIYTLDRFKIQGSNDGAVTISQSTTSPDGFSKSFKVDVTTADTSIAAGQYLQINHRPEAQDLQNLAYGTSAAKTITVSFYVRSNVTGTYTFTIQQADNSSKQVSQTYTINSANTWERKTFTFAGDTSGVINDDNGVGFQINWNLAIGSTYTSGTSRSVWTAYADGDFAAGHTANLLSSTSNEFYLTGVQLEVGQQATPFEHRSFGEELARCSRYLQIFHVPTNNSRRASNITATVHGTGSGVYLNVAFPYPMRAAPSLTVDGAFGGNVFTGSWAGATLSSITAEYHTDTLSTLGFHGITAASVTGSHTTGLTGQIYTNSSGTDAALIYSAEL